MQSKTGGPRSGLSEATVEAALLYERGGRIRWRVDTLDQAGDRIGAFRMIETTEEDWSAGTLENGAYVDGGVLTGEEE